MNQQAVPFFLDRIQVVQDSLDALGNGTYLEIGVDAGVSFIPVNAKRKWGVDPGHKLTRRRVAKYAAFSMLRVKDERIFKVPSDEFFVANRKLLGRFGIDVGFVDGLHTYDQALKDTLNILQYLQPQGLIVLHDCNPTTEVMATPASSIEEMDALQPNGWDRCWTGDVWKVIVHLRALRDDVRAFVLDCDFGVGIVTRGHNTRLPYTEEQIRAMDFPFLAENRVELLGLREPRYFKQFLSDHLKGR